MLTFRNILSIAWAVVTVILTISEAVAANSCRVPPNDDNTDKAFELVDRGLKVYGTLVGDGADRVDVCFGYGACSWGPITSTLQKITALKAYLGPGFCNKKAKLNSATAIDVFCDSGHAYKTNEAIELLKSIRLVPPCGPLFTIEQHKVVFFGAPIVSEKSLCVFMAFRSDDFVPYFFMLPTCKEAEMTALFEGEPSFDFSSTSSPQSRIVVITKKGFGWASLFDDTTLKVKAPDLFVGYSSSNAILNKWLAAIVMASENKTPLPNKEQPIANIPADDQLGRILQWYGAAVIRISSQEPNLRSSARNWMARAAIDPSNAFTDTLLRTELLP